MDTRQRLLAEIAEQVLFLARLNPDGPAASCARGYLADLVAEYVRQYA